MNIKKAILISGGMDSTSLAFWFKDQLSLGITVDYGQNCSTKEISVSRRICQELNIDHEVVKIDCSSLGAGDMFRDSENTYEYANSEWWPYRNQLLITLASVKAINHGVNELLLGTVKSDNMYMDGSETFYKNINRLIVAQEGKLRIKVPAIRMTTIELIVKSRISENLLLWTHSCNRSNIPCGECNSCLKYKSTLDDFYNKRPL